MNGSVKCVEKQNRNSECMHVKCKYVITVVWNISTRFKFHFYQYPIENDIPLIWEYPYCGIFTSDYFSCPIFHNFWVRVGK
jgi:hypothetical protein